MQLPLASRNPLPIAYNVATEGGVKRPLTVFNLAVFLEHDPHILLVRIGMIVPNNDLRLQVLLPLAVHHASNRATGSDVQIL